MSIVKHDLYTIVCDICKDVFVDTINGIEPNLDKSDIHEIAISNGWRHSTRLKIDMCPKCYNKKTQI